MTWHFLSNERLTVAVGVENGIIVSYPPICRKFVGQPIGNLRNWMKKSKGYKEEIIR